MAAVKTGFNMLWCYSRWKDPLPREADERELDFIAEEGFNFIRVPADYRFFVPDGDFTRPREEALAFADRYLAACRERGLHMCLNLHRAPGYCVNRPETEGRNLWRDADAQRDFISLWLTFTRRYQGVPSSALSFDLVNEPDEILPTHPCSRADHEKVIRKTVSAILAQDPDRQLVIDGFHGGHEALPELKDLGLERGVVHSGRGYTPFPLTHHRAEWVRGGDMNAPMPEYPCVRPDGQKWDIGFLRRFYAPWKELSDAGVPVHIGEFGCYNKVENETALRWFTDLLTVFRENGWGWSLWNFRGPFGIVEHGRPGTVYEDHKGFRVDRRLLELLRP
ncbi:MAG: cellulase family glycosylhydrolase [Clostridia bacterium]|nr:cellulase family glycosylhydrolase [Clostridia bacterium]